MKVLWEGKRVDVLHELCLWRSCFHPGEWKGVINPGVGYQYAPKSQWHWECFHRAQHGCPYPIPAPSVEEARCCDSPKVRPCGSSTPQPKRQRCLSCGTWLTGFPLAIARNVWGQYILSGGRLLP